MNLGQQMILLEKNHYPFKRYPKSPCSSLVFPGCSFPSQFPKSCLNLERLCHAHGAGIGYDCCGKPVAELGRARDGERITRQISRRLAALKVQELVCVCPNCMEYLQGAVDLPIVSIYAKLAQWGVSKPEKRLEGMYFPPCPDRKGGAMRKEIAALVPLGGLSPIGQVPCCGLRASIAAHGPSAAGRLCASVKEQAQGRRLYTYCASCSGQFARHGLEDVRHLLPVLLGVDEAPCGGGALFNRARMKFHPV